MGAEEVFAFPFFVSWVVAAIGIISLAVVAFSVSTRTGFYFLFLPFYSVYFMFSHWRNPDHATGKQAKFVLAGLVGVILARRDLWESFESWGEFPQGWEFGRDISGWIDTWVDWLVVNGDPIFDFINTTNLRYLMGPIENQLLWLPWWLLVASIGFLAYKIIGPKPAVILTVLALALAFLGLFDLAMQTLAIVLVATVIAVGVGLPLGVIGAKSDRFDAAIRPILDAMQTLPSFVYLVPAIMLFGLGKTPAVMAVVIYSIPPIIRLTNLGIREVDPEAVEAARAFGSTSRQILAKVQLPMALPTVMAGVNQTIMMALAMVVIASMIGAKGLGVEVLNGIARLEVGRGFLGGLGIVIMAITIDRISQGLAKPRQRASG